MGDISLLVLILFMLAAAAAIYGIFYLLKKTDENKLKKKRYCILPVYFLLIIFVQLIFVILLEFTPVWDMEAFYSGADSVARTNAISGPSPYHGTLEQYFAITPFNTGPVLFMGWLFKFLYLFGLNTYQAAAIVNITVIDLSIYFLYLTCKKMYGIKMSLIALTLCALTSVIYFYAPVAYSDSLSMLYPILCFYFYIQSKDKKGYKKYLLLAGAGIAAGMGYLIKGNALVMGIAIIIDILLNSRFILRNFKYAAAAGASIFLVILSFNFFIRDHLLDPELRERKEMPLSHYIMMGMEYNGGYNPEAFEYTWQFDTYEERDAACRLKINEYINEYGLCGMIDLYYRKTVHTFNDGTFDAAETLNDYPVSMTQLHEYALDDGAYFRLYFYWSHSVYVLILMLNAAFAVSYFKNGGKTKKHPAQLLALTGMWALCYGKQKRE